MQRTVLFIALVLSTTPSTGLSQESDVKSLIAERRPEIQEQINRVYSFYRNAAFDDLKNHGELLEELQRLGNITEDKSELVKQLAIFVATTESEEDLHSIVAGDLLNRLRLPASIPIGVLAPYLDAENERLRSFARGWFHNHDSCDHKPGHAPFGCVNYYEYLGYVRNQRQRNEEVPAGFIKYIYEKHPGKALTVFAYANQHGDVTARLFAIRKSLEGAKPETKEEQELYEKGRKLETKESREARVRARREIQLAEHIVSNAIWLKENEFTELFQAALPEAKTELAKLAQHKEWWARLYVAYIMRQYRELRDAGVMHRLGADSNELVREAVKVVKK